MSHEPIDKRQIEAEYEALCTELNTDHTMKPDGCTKTLPLKEGWLMQYPWMELSWMQYTFEQQALWLNEQLPSLRFEMAQDNSMIITVWFLNSNDDSYTGDCDDDYMRVGGILQYLLGAYLCGPACNVVVHGRRWHQSFGFWNQALLENARRVLPLPDEAQAGPAIFIGGASRGDFEAFERVYNKLPEELPRW